MVRSGQSYAHQQAGPPMSLWLNTLLPVGAWPEEGSPGRMDSCPPLLSPCPSLPGHHRGTALLCHGFLPCHLYLGARTMQGLSGTVAPITFLLSAAGFRCFLPGKGKYQKQEPSTLSRKTCLWVRLAWKTQSWDRFQATKVSRKPQ